MRTKRIAVIAGLVLAAVIAIACSSAKDPAPTNADTLPSGSAPAAAAAAPVTVTGHGEAVKTVELVKHGYTVAYQASSFCLIAAPVNGDGSDGFPFITNCAAKIGDHVSGTTTYSANGPVTLHISNTDGDWSLTFTPLG